MKNITIVVSRYNEDLRWLDDSPFNEYEYIVYNKSDNDNFCKTNKRPKSAIVFLDELDKLASNGSEEGKDFGSELQEIFLSWLHGTPVSKEGATYDISNWWFIGTGAFSALKGCHDEVDERSTTARTHEDIIGYGFKPEFVGRFHTIIPFRGHTLETMVKVITCEGSPIILAQNEFKLFYDIELIFAENALQKLAELRVSEQV